MDGKSGEDALVFTAIVFCGGIISCGLMVALLRRRFVLSRLVLWMLFICVASCVVVVGVLIVAFTLSGVPGPGSLKELLFFVFAMGGTLGAITYALLLPYLLLAILSPFYGKRLTEIVGGLKVQAEPQADDDQASA